MSAKVITSKARDETELWIDGKFVASWVYVELSDEQRDLISQMIGTAVEFGESKKAEQIRKVIGATK